MPADHRTSSENPAGAPDHNLAPGQDVVTVAPPTRALSDAAPAESLSDRVTLNPVSADPRIDRLLSRCQALREQGQPTDVNALCQDCPELRDEVQRRLQVVGSMQQPLASTVAPGEDKGDGNRIPPIIPGYEIMAELGRGGMGVVYKAHHLGLNRLVALKMILAGGHASSDDLLRFLAEAEAVAAFQHPNIVQVFEVGKHAGLPYMALEYVPGGSLADRLKKGLPPAKETARLLEQLARGMNAAHQAGIVHRDLKPGNVLLAEGGTPKITDFGLAKRVQGDSGLTQTGAVLGTPAYMAPEQAGGEGKRVGPAADVYALGTILYECLTGRPPFQGPPSLDTLLQVISQEPVPPRQHNAKVPRDLETICLGCLHKEPLKRYASAEGLAEDLRRWQAGEPITARPVGRWERLVKWVRRRPAAAALTTVSVLALVTVFGGGMYFNAELQTANTGLIQSHEEMEKANTKLIDSGKALQKSNDELRTSVARGLLRPLVLRFDGNAVVAPLTDPEIEALWELASSPDDKLRLAFVEDAIRGPGPTR
jgi:serine/threonine-protein kinase